MHLFLIIFIYAAAFEKLPKEPIAFMIDSEASVDGFRQLHLLWDIFLG
jgi:hypothetical protein